MNFKSGWKKGQGFASLERSVPRLKRCSGMPKLFCGAIAAGCPKGLCVRLGDNAMKDKKETKRPLWLRLISNSEQTPAVETPHEKQEPILTACQCAECRKARPDKVRFEPDKMAA